MINIKPHHIDGCNCYEDLIANIVQAYNLKHEFLFSSSWNFELREFILEEYSESNRIGNLLYIKDDVDKLIDEYYGIKINWILKANLQTALDIIKEELNKNNPIILAIDGYNIPWNANYQKIHFKHHCCMVIDLDLISNSLICMDPFYVEESTEYLSLDNLDIGCDYLGLISKQSNYTILSKVDIVEKLSKKRLEINNDISLIRKFATIVKKYFNKELEFSELKSLWDVPIVMNITNIANSRLKFSQYLAFISVEYHIDLLNIIEDLKSSCSKWNIVRSLLFKLYYSNNNLLIDNISSTISSIADFEENINKNMYKSIQIIDNEYIKKINNSVDILSDVYKGTPTDKYLYLNINSFFNNNAFVNLQDFKTINSKSQGIDYNNLFFVFDNSNINRIETNSIWLRVLKNLSNNINDNIACNNQLIKVSPNKYKGIIILACSVYWENAENIIINYVNGTSETLSIKFPILPNIENYGYEVALQTNMAKLINGEFIIEHKTSYLFSKNISISKTNIQIDNIVLPDNINLHIFGIILIETNNK